MVNDKSILENWAEEYLSDDEKYRNHINKFVKFINRMGKGNRPININEEDVILCIGYYNDLGQINSISSMENHIESVKAFYRFLVKKGYTHDIFSSVYSYQEFKDKIIEKYDLKETKEREYFSEQLIKEILQQIDNYLQYTNFNHLQGINEKKQFLSNIILRLFIKLSLIAPVKRSVMCNLKISDFIEDFRCVVINNVKIRIPNALRRDILNALSFTADEGQRNYNESSKLFEFIYGDRFRDEKLNEWFCSFLKNIGFDIPKEKYTYSVEVLMKSAIYCLVKNACNPALIAKISGLSISRIEKMFYSNPEITINNLDFLINSEISKSSYYNYI